MEVRIFQIVVPLIALLFSISFFNRFRKAKATIYETVIGICIWIFIGVFALIPDLVSNLIASVFGFKSNVNAIIFLALGGIIFIQFKLYSQLRRQEKAITQLTRQLALKEMEKTG